MTPAFELRAAGAEIAGRRTLDAVSLGACSGEVLGIVGPNGAGKTTLLRTILGLQRLAGGEALLAGRPVAALPPTARARLAAYLPQERAVGWNLPAWRIAALGAADQPPREAERRARAALDRVGLAALAERGVLDMSGGERARALLARLLVTEAPLLLADEPVAGLDPAAQLQTLEILRQQAAAGAAVVVTLHDLTLAARYCDRVAVLAAGTLVAEGPPQAALGPATLAAVFNLLGGMVSTPQGPVLSAGPA